MVYGRQTSEKKKSLQHNNWSINVSWSFIFLEDIWDIISNMLSRMLSTQI